MDGKTPSNSPLTGGEPLALKDEVDSEADIPEKDGDEVIKDEHINEKTADDDEKLKIKHEKILDNIEKIADNIGWDLPPLKSE